MSCETCGHTRHRLGADGPGGPLAWCPRCGSLSGCQADGSADVPALVARCREFSEIACSGSICGPAWYRLGIAEAIRPPMTDGDRRALIPGDWVTYRDDFGRELHARVKFAPWMLPHGDWLLGLDGIAGGYLLSRVVAKNHTGLPTQTRENARLRAALELIAACRHVSGSAQGAFRANLRVADAALAGADLGDMATVEAVAAGTWTPGTEV